MTIRLVEQRDSFCRLVVKNAGIRDPIDGQDWILDLGKPNAVTHVLDLVIRPADEHDLAALVLIYEVAGPINQLGIARV